MKRYDCLEVSRDYIENEDLVVTSLGGLVDEWYNLRPSGGNLYQMQLGTVGPISLGIAYALPHRRVVCLNTDGSLLMNIQELVTAVEEGVNVKIILMNNNSLGLVHQQQELFYGGRLFASDYRTPVDFLTIARGFGMSVYDLAAAAEPHATLARALGSRGPCLIHAPIEAREKVYPMVPPGAANKDMMGGEASACPAALANRAASGYHPLAHDGCRGASHIA
jgi:acetolactate synthase-1/2/3 large subunit